MMSRALWAVTLSLLIASAEGVKDSGDYAALAELVAREAARLLEVEKGLATRMREESQKTFPGTDAGENLDAILYADVIAVAKRAVELDSANVAAHTVLAEAYFTKSYEGEGSYTTKLVQAARQEAEFVIRALGPKIKNNDHHKTAQRILEKVRALRPEELLP